ncbi:MAG: phosphoribosylanthranilate isomerase [Silicimonas sp.]|nr:phosphoribosylanthranilate isomerase [Silicimonas sp.]
MASDIRVKVCGLTSPETIAAAAQAGVAYIGLNFFAKSPRSVTAEQARDLAVETPVGVAKVGLVVDMDDAALGAILDLVPLDMVQLHGGETPERVAEIREKFGLPVMKAIGIAGAEDLAKIDLYAPVADQLLIDAKPPKDGPLPGGNGISFDWRLIANRRWTRPWMLAGGLTPDNVAEAVALTGAKQVDVASGVESAPGVKDAGLIRAFMGAV